MNYQLSVSTDPTNWEAELVVPGSPLCAQLGPAQGSVAQDTPEALGLFHPPAGSPLPLASSLLPGKVFSHSSLWPAFPQRAGHQRGFIVSAGLVRTTENKP